MSSSSAPPVTATDPKSDTPKLEQPQKTDKDTAKEDTGKSWLLKTMGSLSVVWLFSGFTHLILIIGLGLFSLSQLSDKEPIHLTASSTTEDIETMIDVPLEPEDIEEVDDAPEDFSELIEEPQESSSLSEPLKLPAITLTKISDFGSLTDKLETEFGGGDIGTKGVSKGNGDSSIFKSSGPEAEKVVYVVDNSSSMIGFSPRHPGFGRMETALAELSKSVNALKKSQKLYIIFYSDAAYGLFYPETEKDYIFATSKNKQRVGKWLNTIECCSRTSGKEAFELARKLKPDLLYILGDGAFGDGADKRLIANPIQGARVEVLGMNLIQSTAFRFKALAAAHNGNYRDVGITEDGLRVLQEYGPRKRNNLRGPVWGINLPEITIPIPK